MDPSIDWLIKPWIHWLIDWSNRGSHDWLIDWSNRGSIDWLIDWLIHRRRLFLLGFLVQYLWKLSGRHPTSFSPCCWVTAPTKITSFLPITWTTWNACWISTWNGTISATSCACWPCRAVPSSSTSSPRGSCPPCRVSWWMCGFPRARPSIRIVCCRRCKSTTAAPKWRRKRTRWCGIWNTVFTCSVSPTRHCITIWWRCTVNYAMRMPCWRICSWPMKNRRGDQSKWEHHAESIN